MGRYCGDLTLAAAIAGGCEFVVVPEVEFSREDLVAEIKGGIAKGKKHAIVAITEHICDVDELAKYIETETKRETRATVLGHIQRGGSPGPYDRILASRMGAYAIELLLQGHGGRCVGIQNEKLVCAGWRLRLTRPTKARFVGPVSEAPPGFFCLHHLPFYSTML